jgi:hypothetical protein
VEIGQEEIVKKFESLQGPIPETIPSNLGEIAY